MLDGDSSFFSTGVYSFGRKHEIAQVTAQLQAQVEVANLSRKHKNEMLKRIADAWPSLSQ